MQSCDRFVTVKLIVVTRVRRSGTVTASSSGKAMKRSPVWPSINDRPVFRCVQTTVGLGLPHTNRCSTPTLPARASPILLRIVAFTNAEITENNLSKPEIE